MLKNKTNLLISHKKRKNFSIEIRVKLDKVASNLK